MLAKVIAVGGDREQALDTLGAALGDARVDGVVTNLGLLRAALALPDFRSALHSTSTLDGLTDPEPRIEVLEPGALTTVQDWPGRLGYWQVGVPPSGPMDEVSLREANLAVGNPEGAPALECTATGPSLKFSHDTVVCLGGAVSAASLDGPAARTACPCPGGNRSPCRPGRPSRSARSAGPGCAATWPCAAASTCPPTWAARRRSRWAGSAGTAAAPSRRATSCAPARSRRARAFPLRHRSTDAPRSRVTGRSGSPRDRTRHRSSSPGPTSTSCTPAATPCITTRPAPASGSSDRVRRGHARTAARPGCTRPTSTMSPTRSARSTSPATRRSSSARTARASAGSSARRSSRAASCGRWGSFGRGTPCASCRCARRTRRPCGTGAPRRRWRAPAATATTASWPGATADRTRRPWSTAATATTT